MADKICRTFTSEYIIIRRAAALLLGLVLAAMPLMLAGCGAEEDFSGAEEAVRSALEAVKTDGATLPAAGEFEGDVSEAMLEAYVSKLKDFEYEIVSAERDEEDSSKVDVTVNITTYDFGSVYLETMNDQMKIEESARYESQFYNDLFTRIAALGSKDYKGQAVIVCTEGEGGGWKTDVKTNESLADALSGGMVGEMKELAGE